MIQDLKHMGLFRVDVCRLVLDLPHEDISKYILESRKTWDRYTTYHDPKLNKQVLEGMPAYEKFVDTIKEGAMEYVKRSGRKAFKDKDDIYLWSWISVYDEHDQHGSHIHPKTLVAGTYYPQTDKDSASIMLEAPWTNHCMHDTLPFNAQTFDYKPNPGDALLWPAWINHRVPLQPKAEKKRIAISFNIDYIRYHD